VPIPVPARSRIWKPTQPLPISNASTELAAIERIFPREGGVSGARHAYDDRRAQYLNTQPDGAGSSL